MRGRAVLRLAWPAIAALMLAQPAPAQTEVEGVRRSIPMATPAHPREMLETVLLYVGCIQQFQYGKRMLPDPVSFTAAAIEHCRPTRQAGEEFALSVATRDWPPVETPARAEQVRILFDGIDEMYFAAGRTLAEQLPADTVEKSSRYTQLEDCSEIAHGDIDRGEDWVAHKCIGLGGIPIWLRFSDSARSFIGFGAREHNSGMFGLARDNSWPVEWRGVEADGQFEPFAVILRMTLPATRELGEDAGSLFVFRLREDGLSCMVDAEIESNEQARLMADLSWSGYQCLFEPDLPDQR
jgi:hypothetical protein